MRRQSLHESLGGSVMTTRSRGRAQISRDHPPPPPSLLLESVPALARCLRLPVTTGIVSSCYARKSTTRGSSREIPTKTIGHSALPPRPPRPPPSTSIGDWAHGLTQIAKVPGRSLVLYLVVFSLLTGPAMAKPGIEIQPDRMTFKSRYCQPVSTEDLKKRLGSAYDEKMAADMPADWKGYQNDGPAAADLEDPDSILEATEQFLSSGDIVVREEGMVYSNNNGDVEKREKVDVDFGDEELEVEFQHEELEDSSSGASDTSSGGGGGGDLGGAKTRWPSRRRNSKSRRRDRDRERFDSASYKKFLKTNENDEEVKGHHGVSDSFKYMRRKRRRRSVKATGVSRTSKSQSSDALPKKGNMEKIRHNSNRKKASGRNRHSSKKVVNNYYALKLLLTGKLHNSKKLRKQLKKEFRQQNKKVNKPPPWQCKFQHRTINMNETVFPRYVQDGFCATDKCFYRLYNCEPIKYGIKMLHKDVNDCVPLPLVGNNTVYEEKWVLSRRTITVGCNCASVVGSNKPKSRRKN